MGLGHIEIVLLAVSAFLHLICWSAFVSHGARFRKVVCAEEAFRAIEASISALAAYFSVYSLNTLLVRT